MKASLGSVETFGLVDGPGIRCVFFLNGCMLRCKYCHNPEMWTKGEENLTVEEVVERAKRCKPYFKDKGGVTFSGGEPLLHSKFIIECAKELHKVGINVALDTAGVGLDDYDDILPYIDLVILDIKHTDPKAYQVLTGLEQDRSERFIEALKKHNNKLWIRQVVVPGLMDNEAYIDSLVKYLDKFTISNIDNIEFLPYHRLGREKYITLGIEYPYENMNEMNKEECDKLFNLFKEKYNKTYKDSKLN